MRIDVTFRGLEPQRALREQAVRRLEAQLSRCGDAITAAFVRFIARRDAGPDADRHCQITVAFTHRSGSATVEALHPDPLVALDLAAGRIGRALSPRRRAATPSAPATTSPTRLLWTPA